MNQSKGKANGNARNNQNKNNNKSSKPANQKGSGKQSSNQQRRPTERKSGAQQRTSVASAYATAQLTGQAHIVQQSMDSCRIRHRELVASITGSTPFTVSNTFSINPGLAASFPWLSVQAQGWEKYRFNSFKVCAYTRTGSNVPGSELLIPDYDAADSAPVNEQIASSYHGTAEDAPWKDICCVFDSKRLGMERFVRSGNLAANLDIKLYDVANFYVATVDGTAVNWSKLWFEYDITLINQQLPAGGPSGSGTLVSAGGSIAAATPFGAVPVSTGSYNLSGAATNVLTASGLNIGSEYMLSISSVGTVITGYANGGATGSTQVTDLFVGFNSAATRGAYVQTFTANASTVTVTINVTATTITNSYVVLSALTPAPSF